jgi:hypothetical protein
MEAWYKTTLPRQELREGRSLDPSEFAVHLDQIAGEKRNAPSDYLKPDEFFKRTYFSSALTDYCGIVLRRLVGETANTAPVLSLITQFGGGKTHTLATLYHLVTSGAAARDYEGVENLLKKIGLGGVPDAQPAIFVGNSWDATTDSETPWLDLARQLAGDAGRRVLGEAARTTAPGTTALQSLFQLVNRPILILFDETLNYIGRYPDQSEQFHSFLQNLTSALTGTERAVGVFSLPASPTEMTDRLFQWQTRLSKVVGRVGKPLIANDPEEISEIIRRRLFEDAGKLNVRKAIAKQYADWVFARNDRLPPEFANFPVETIRKQFEACYPFHPATLTVFQRKWAALQTFQQTRGTLAMLGLWIAQAYREGYQKAWREPLITLGSAPLYNREFRSKILEQLGEQRLEAAIDYDIAGENAHAIALDREFSDGVGKQRLHQRTATALFFESCGGMATDRAATLLDLRFALGNPEIETTLVDVAVQALASRCYFLRPIGTSGWRFGYAPTLRKVHAERKTALDPADIERNLNEIIKQVFLHKKECDVQPFPRNSNDVADRPVLTLIILPPGLEWNAAVEEQLRDWTTNCGQTLRQYPGALLWLVPESEFGLRDAVADWLAWRSVTRDVEQGLLGELDEQEKQRAATELRQAKDIIEEKAWSLYNRLLIWASKDQNLQSVPLGQMHSSEAQSITAAILARLRQASLLNREIGASYVVRNWPEAFKASGAWPLASLRAAFFQGHLTRLQRADEVLRQMLLQAIGRGDLGLGVGRDETHVERVWFKELPEVAEVSFDHETFALLPARALTEKQEEGREGEVKPIPVAGPIESDETKGEELEFKTESKGKEASAPSVPQTYTLQWRGQLPKDKWNLLSHRLLNKLTADQVKIEVSINATTTDATIRQQLNTGLGELGLIGEFTEQRDEP